jgi:threonine/homoserine/homoserine lactone efflux protein
MTADLLLAFVLFAFATAGTPGPNNMMLLASGANFGVRRTAAHILGISAGLGFMVLAMGWGLGGLFAAVPALYEILKWVGVAYLLYLAWHIATAKGGLKPGDPDARPMTFWQAAAFQWVNPKAWAMALSAVTTYTPHQGYYGQVVVVAVVFMLVGTPCCVAWAAFGRGLRRFLDRPAVLRAFNVTMAVLLVASLYPMLAELTPKTAGPSLDFADVALVVLPRLPR